MIAELLKNKHINVLITVLIGIVLYKIITLVTKRSLEVVLKKTDKGKRKTIIGLINNLIKYVIFIIIVIVVLEIYDVNTQAILASLGVAGLIIGLALQDLLKDLIVGFSIVFENLFKVGDIITIGDFRGEVISISLKTTRIKSVTGEVKALANRNINEIINHSVEIAGTALDVAINYEEDLTKLDKVIAEIIKTVNHEIKELKEPMEFLGYAELADSAIKIRFFFKTAFADKFSTDRKIKRIIIEIFRQNKIVIPYNQLVIHQEK